MVFVIMEVLCLQVVHGINMLCIAVLKLSSMDFKAARFDEY